MQNNYALWFVFKKKKIFAIKDAKSSFFFRWFSFVVKNLEHISLGTALIGIFVMMILFYHGKFKSNTLQFQADAIISHDINLCQSKNG
jgi:hypothetical protein